MFSFMRVLPHAAVYVALQSVLLLGLVIYNPRLMLQDYPPAVKAAVPPKTKREKRLTVLLGLPFLVGLVGYPLYATFRIHAEVGVGFGFVPLVLTAFAIAFIGNLWDLLVLDWLIFCTLTPKRFVLQGTEGHRGYKDYMFHFRGFLIGTVFSGVLGLAVAGLVSVFA